MPAGRKPFNLFVYGTLMDPSTFRAVLGRRLVTRPQDADGKEAFCAQEAVLDDYKKISPDNTYLYAVPDPAGRIRGYLVGPLPADCLDLLRHYEGRNYSRRRVIVQTRGGQEKAVAFLADLRQLSHSFGYAFRDPLKQEILLRKKIDEALGERQRQAPHGEQGVARRAVGELHGPTIRDLVRRHFEAGGISDYAIRASLKDAPLPDYDAIVGDPEAQALAPNYLGLVIRQVIFNEVEDHIREDFRYELDHMDPGENFYERTISSLAALRILNRNQDLLVEMTRTGLAELSFSKDHLVDFVQWAVGAADAFYNQATARSQISLIKSHMAGGYLPLGAELEFSNTGHAVIRDAGGQTVRDSRYDGFLYFHDFGLDSLTWKLGGHVDDHREKASPRRRRGFFEVAFGNLSIEANISKPITDDPWVLNQLIREAMLFYPIQPHSVHVSLQVRRQPLRPDRNRLMPLAVFKCLLAIAGGARRDPGGPLQIHRLATDEIITAEPVPHMLFSEISKRRSAEEEGRLAGDTPASAGRYVQQFRFLKLSGDLNYEPIILALKGAQISLRQGTFLTAGQYQTSRKHRELFDDLLAWGRNAQPLSREEMDCFLGHVKEGLMTEYRGRNAHSEAYIAWGMGELRKMLNRFNALAKEPA